MHRHVVLLEQLDILLQNMEVGEARHHVVEVNSIIPHENIVGNGRPAFERFHEITSRRIIGQRHFAHAINVAQHDVHVRQWLYLLGWMHGKEISQGRNLLVGEAFGQFVHKTDIRARRSTFFFVHLATLLARTESIVTIVLAHRDQLLVRVRLENRVQFFHHEIENVRIRQAPLTVITRTMLAIDIRIIFGVILAINIRRHQAVERMYPHIVLSALPGGTISCKSDHHNRN